MEKKRDTLHYVIYLIKRYKKVKQYFNINAEYDKTIENENKKKISEAISISKQNNDKLFFFHCGSKININTKIKHLQTI